MNYFLVFQNKSYNEERKGGFLWAPQRNHLGQTFHHWTDMRNIKKGDIIFSSYGGQMLSVLVAKEDCIEHEKPVDLDGLDLWEKDGFMVNAEYIDLSVPIVYKDYMNSILALQGEKYAPFNKVGRGNTGYVFRVSTELANFLFEIIEQRNGYSIDIFKSDETSDKQIIEKIEEDVGNYSVVLDKTDQDTIIKARIGQSLFKKALLNLESKCKICGVNDTRFLIASHIKPWSTSNNEERLDVNNGLLLCPNHDSLFDRGFISFEDDGYILVSSILDEKIRIFMNINENIRIDLSKDQREFMKWHREEKFKN
ncbi:HNH endonuclease [Halobacillus litoralis]|uniref:HNH endonuclease n=1 Tax=Halobacillus litoralis TaxID=45668 RepID=A0A845DY70_9BACI|nr:HNH endonuclease signature motif containing protein [Halobacillus litoralis]MYL48295.1 HNH endonuclease [Halobacillus litoralis]